MDPHYNLYVTPIAPLTVDLNPRLALVYMQLLPRTDPEAFERSSCPLGCHHSQLPVWAETLDLALPYKVKEALILNLEHIG